MNCPGCSAALQPDAKFCGECGARARHACGSCGSLNPVAHKFCSECGGALGGAAKVQAASPAPAPAPKPPDAPLAERRQITVMFCDMVGSTALSTQLDPEDLHAVLSAYHRCVDAIAAAHGATVAQYLGDGALLYFGFPRAQERDAEQAVRAGLALIEAVAGLAAGGEPLRVRVGIETGLAMVGDLFAGSHERGAIGETPNIAARLQSVAEPMSVVIGPRTEGLVRRAFELEALEVGALKGLGPGVRPWRVIRERDPALAPGDAAPPKLQGRTKEMQALLAAWREARTGRGRALFLSGEPGIGKSSLAAGAFAEMREARRLRLACSSDHEGAALHPVIRALTIAAGIAREDEASARRGKLDRALAAAGLGDRAIERIAEIMNLASAAPAPDIFLTPQQRRDALLTALCDFLLGGPGRPTAILWEDVHWIDPTSRELMDRLTLRLADAPALLILTHRPGFVPPWQGDHIREIALQRLNARQSAALAAQVAGERELPPALLARIIERTDGNPLYVEEFTRAVLDNHGPLDLEQHAASLTVPSTLQASLMARLDRLGPARDLAQVCAAIGRSFTYELVSAVAEIGHGELRGGLNDLVRSEILTPQRASSMAATTYSFKHALLREAAYSSMLKSRRRGLHARVARSIESVFPELAEEQPELLAHHHASAGERRRAADYLLKASRLSLGRSAAVEAAKHARDGLALLAEEGGGAAQAGDAGAAALHLAHGRALIILKGEHAGETGAAFRSAQEHAGADPQTLFVALDGLCAHHFSRRELSQAIAAADAILALGAEDGTRRDPHVTITGLRARGSASFLIGEFRTARAAFEELLALCRTVPDADLVGRSRGDPRVSSLSFLSLVAAVQGFAAEALAHSAESQALAQGTRHPPSLTFALRIAAFLHTLFENWSEVLKAAQAIIRIARKHAFPVWEQEGRFFEQLALHALEGEASALKGMEEALEAMAGGLAVWPFFVGAVGTARAEAGDLENADRLLRVALNNARDSGELWYAPELLRKRAELVLRMPGLNESAEHLRAEALEIARRQEARLWIRRLAPEGTPAGCPLTGTTVEACPFAAHERAGSLCACEQARRGRPFTSLTHA
jgi:class 3 adenylate cyclase/tetratricopeptide (TPR) repeat protein